MHFIQSKILDQLLYNEKLRYSQLKPEGVESNHFAYHLKELQKDKLVARVDGGYTLAPKGLAYVDRLSHKHMKTREQPKIVTMIKITNPDQQQLLFKRNYQPYIHCYGWPSGKIHLDETVPEAANRELLEKTGLSGVALEHRGIIDLEVRQAGFVISRVMIHVFSGELVTSSSPIGGSRGECRWGSFEDMPDELLMPASKKIDTLLSSQKFFFETIKAEA